MSVIAMVVQTKEEAGFFRKRVDIVGMRGSALISEMVILEKTKAPHCFLCLWPPRWLHCEVEIYFDMAAKGLPPVSVFVKISQGDAGNNFLLHGIRITKVPKTILKTFGNLLLEGFCQ